MSHENVLRFALMGSKDSSIGEAIKARATDASPEATAAAAAAVAAENGLDFTPAEVLDVRSRVEERGADIAATAPITAASAAAPIAAGDTLDEAALADVHGGAMSSAPTGGGVAGGIFGGGSGGTPTGGFGGLGSNPYLDMQIFALGTALGLGGAPTGTGTLLNTGYQAGGGGAVDDGGGIGQVVTEVSTAVSNAASSVSNWIKGLF